MGKFDAEKLLKLKKIDNFFKFIYFFRKKKVIRPNIIKTDIKEIIIMGMMMIGDTVMMIPALRAIKRNFPDARISIVCGGIVKTVLINEELINDFYLVNSPWLIKDYSFSSLYKLLKSFTQINKKKYDLALDFRGDWRNIFFMNFIKAKRKASFNYSGGEYMLTDVIEPNPLIDHYSDEWLYFLEQLGCEILDSDRIPVLHVNNTDKVFLDDFCHQNKLNGKFLIGVHPGASQDVKKWDEDKYSELIKRLSKERNNCKFLVFEGPNERDTVSKIEKSLVANNIDFLVVNRVLHEYIIILSLCEIIICNDSGAAHIAGAFGIPTVVMFGNVDPKYVTPRGAGILKVISKEMECKPCHKSFCRFGTNACIVAIEIDEVEKAVSDILIRSSIK